MDKTQYTIFSPILSPFINFLLSQTSPGQTVFSELSEKIISPQTTPADYHEILISF
jgi:hypothetical protein